MPSGSEPIHTWPSLRTQTSPAPPSISMALQGGVPTRITGRVAMFMCVPLPRVCGLFHGGWNDLNDTSHLQGTLTHKPIYSPSTRQGRILTTRTLQRGSERQVSSASRAREAEDRILLSQEGQCYHQLPILIYWPS